MIEFARVFFNIALLRQGPQDLPASTLLFILVMALETLWVLLMVLGFGLDPVRAFDRYGVAAVLDLTLPTAVLSIAGRLDRFLQVVTATAGAGLVIAPLEIALFAIARFSGPLSTPPDWAQLVEYAIIGWGVVIQAHVYRCALERIFLLCLILACACEIMILTSVNSLFPLTS